MVIGGPNSQFENNFNEKFKSLKISLEYRTNRINKILTDAYSKPQVGTRYWSAVRTKLDIEYKAMNSLFINWTKIEVPKAFRYSVKELMDRLNRNRAIARRADKTFSALVTMNKNIIYTGALVKDSITDFSASLVQGNGNLQRLTRRTQQALITEAEINQTVLDAINKGNLLDNALYKKIGASDSLTQILDQAQRTINNEGYVIAGSRKFRPDYYAEMVSRVKFHEAQAYGAIQTAGNYDTDLLQVSAHNTTTVICQEFENKIFSVGGKDKRFPLLTDTSPFHPNCLHNMYPVFISELESTKTLSQWEEFSKGKTQTPPYPSSFIPIGDR